MDKGRVKASSGLNFRDKPNGDVLDVLAHDEEFQILDEVTFYRVRTSSGKVGYVHGSYVEKMPDDTTSVPVISPESPNDFNPVFKPIIFANEAFTGETIRVDHDFARELERLGEFAADCSLKIWVTSSLRPLNNQVRGAIVKPATKSCHHIGHAIDMNLLHGGKLYNSKKLKKSNHANLPTDITRFFDLIRGDEVLRWGGDFTTQDPVHIDDNIFNTREILYQAKLDSRVSKMNA